jgi:hypothetical protein
VQVPCFSEDRLGDDGCAHARRVVKMSEAM